MNNLFLKIGKFSLNKQKEGNSEGKVVEKAQNETASVGSSRNIPAQSEPAKSTIIQFPHPARMIFIMTRIKRKRLRSWKSMWDVCKTK